jgi:hypothetical protein
VAGRRGPSTSVSKFSIRLLCTMQNRCTRVNA